MGKMLDFYMMPHPPIMISKVGLGEEEKIKDTKVLIRLKNNLILHYKKVVFLKIKTIQLSDCSS